MSVILSYKQKGLTLLETLLALAVAVIILGGIYAFYKNVQNNSNIAATIKIVDNISDAMRTYAQTSSYTPGTTSFLSTLQTQGLLTPSDTVNPWDKSSAPTVYASGNYMGIYFNSVPSGSCTILANQLSSSLPMPAAGSVTLNGVAYTITSTGISGTWSGCGGKCSTGTSNGAAGCLSSSTGTPLVVILDLS